MPALPDHDHDDHGTPSGIDPLAFAMDVLDDDDPLPWENYPYHPTWYSEPPDSFRPTT